MTSIECNHLCFTDPNQFANEETYTVAKNSDHKRSFNKTMRNYAEDRPITPMRATYRQIAEKFGDEDGLPIDPNLTNQYYEAYNDFEKEDDYSPTREQNEREFHDQICRSISCQEIAKDRQRAKSASQSSTMNSMSRTIDPHHKSSANRPSRYLAQSRTIATTSKQKSLSNKSLDENNNTLKDNPICDAYGPLAKSRKITSLRA